MLSKKLRLIAMESLNKFDMIEEDVWRDWRWGQAETDFLKFCIVQNHLTESDFREAVRERICNIGSMMQRKASGPNAEYADHVTSPHALAFAISQKHFGWLRKRDIRFDNGDTTENFMEGLIDNLLEDIMTQLLHDTPVSSTSSEPGDHEFCVHD